MNETILCVLLSNQLKFTSYLTKLTPLTNLNPRENTISECL